MPVLAANLSFLFTERPFADRIAAAATAGFRAVECLFPYAHGPEALAEALVEARLDLALFNMPPGDWARGDRGLAALPDRRAEFRAGLAEALAAARHLRPRRLHVMAGCAPASDPGARRTYRDSLRRAADATAEAGIGLTIEPLNPRDMPGYFLADFAQAAEVIAEVDHPNLQLQFDIYHRQILHGDVIRGLAQYLPITGHVQIAAVPDRGEPGSGELDDAAVLAALSGLGYTGFVGCEYHPRAGTEAGLGWRARLLGPGWT